MPDEETTNTTETTEATETTSTTGTTSTTETTSTTDTTETTSTTSTTQITPFTLPRLDWYDEEGRIYKDALIENFNALEAKLNEINALSAFSSTVPDISNVHLEDVTLEDEDNKVVNLKSFLTIFDLVNYPIELTFSGTKVLRIAYWNSSYKYIEKTNLTTSATATNKYIIFNFTDGTVRSSSSSTLQTGESLIGAYINGRVITLTSPYIARLNLDYLLGNMPKSTYGPKWVGHGVGEEIMFAKSANGTAQQAALVHAESKSGSHSGNQIFRQEGRVN